MNHRIHSILVFGGTLAAAVLGAAAMTGPAWAEGPIGESTPFTSTRTAAEVQAELIANRHLLSSSGSEWAMQQGEPRHPASGYTSAQARADYIASRDEVRAMNSEDGGSGYFARSNVRTPGPLYAGDLAR
jgi:hypothetical protein